MKPVIRKLKPSRGFAHVVYILLNLLLPALVFALVKTGFVVLALAIILISKWRMLAVRPRFWGANLRANAVDIITGVSVLGLMVISPNDWVRIGFAAGWAFWLIVIKPKMSVLWVSLQALIGLMFGLAALFAVFPQASLAILVAGAGLICFFAAHHFFYSFDEPHTALLSSVWGFFGAAITWILAHWLLFYWAIAQPALLLVSISTVFGSLYYLDHFDRLTKGIRRQLVVIGFAIVAIIWMSLVYFYWIRGSQTIV